MAVRRVIADAALVEALRGAVPGVEVEALAGGLDPAPLEPREVLVVTADPEALADAGGRGLQRLVPGDDPAATVDAVRELVAFLDRGERS